MMTDNARFWWGDVKITLRPGQLLTHECSTFEHRGRYVVAIHDRRHIDDDGSSWWTTQCNVCPIELLQTVSRMGYPGQYGNDDWGDVDWSEQRIPFSELYPAWCPVSEGFVDHADELMPSVGWQTARMLWA